MTRLSNVLDTKKPGEEWYSIQAPEELHTWNIKNPWKEDFYKEYGVYLFGAKFRTDIDVKKFPPERYTKKSPLLLSSGSKVEQGQVKTRMVTTASFFIRADTAKELSRSMTEISKNFNASIWFTKNIYILSQDRKVEFKYHNPDGHGASLMFWAEHHGTNHRLYPDVALHWQQELCKGFIERVSHCTAGIEEVPVHACALEAKIKHAQIRKRK